MYIEMKKTCRPSCEHEEENVKGFVEGAECSFGLDFMSSMKITDFFIVMKITVSTCLFEVFSVLLYFSRLVYSAMVRTCRQEVDTLNC